MASSKKSPKPAASKQGKPTQTKPRQGGPTAAKRPAPALLGSGAPLVALVDGVALPDAESEALWRAFSAHMDQHQGDLAGFAKARGFRDVKPEYRRGQAVLLVTR